MSTLYYQVDTPLLKKARKMTNNNKPLKWVLLGIIIDIIILAMIAQILKQLK